ncbi:STAS domain-containing protein [Actinoplanes sp. N902-109]|uniref:STAS domain-containing protein n=1 Tax=Actinoplanes sp. (strain N902-109) TaxID=649831 RepID=UPI0003A8CF65|nr:STAS domain-containing protein [Actinoplanes sp. N902-109]
MTEPSYQIAREAGHVRLSGEFDINARDDLRDAMVRAVQHDGQGRVVIDLDGTDFIDSEALGALIDGLTAGRAAGVAMSIVNAHGLVHRVLDVSGVLALFDPVEG